mgnify:CR=1 FL=1
MENKYGEFCEIFGITPRNIIIEFFLEMRGLDFSIGDVAKETGLNRATTYNTIEELIKAKYLIPTRKVSGSQLYVLNTDKEEVKVLINTFNMILKSIAEKYKEKQKIIA